MQSPLGERFRNCTFNDVLVSLLFLTMAVTACVMPAQSDTWWLLRAGEDTWAHGRPVLYDTYSFAVNGGFWPNHEWLSQALFFGAYRVGGMPLLTLMAAAALCGAWAIVWRLAPGTARTRFVLVALALLSSCGAWTIRPQVLTQLCLALGLWLVAHRRVTLLPLLMFVWANLHGGFVMGLVLVFGAVASILLTDRRQLLRPIIIALASILVTLATPLGLTLWTEIPASLDRLREYRVAEWQRPELLDPTLLPFWVAAAVLVGLSAWRLRDIHRRSAPDGPDMLAVCISALAMLPLALRTERNVAPFLLLTVPALATLWPASWQLDRRPTRERHRLNRSIIAIAATASVAIVVYGYAARIERLQWTPLPKPALAALAGCDGRVYNRYDEGGYLIWFARDRKVFIDSRQDPYPPSLVKEQIDVETTGAYEHTFDRYAIACAYVAAGSPVATHLALDGWATLYADEKWAVLAHDAAPGGMGTN